jgi:hypothetical protein
MAHVLHIPGSTRVLVPSFVDGGRIAQTEIRFRETESEAMIRALALESQGRRDEADRYLTEYLRRFH